MPERQSKATQGRHERMLHELLKLPGNDRCADCGSKNPRWASYSLGIFLCIRCAGLHRKMGTHISRVKSVTMDEWSLEQIDMMRKGGGNDKVNLSVNPHPDRHCMPVGDDEGDRALERYIRNKWEKRAFVDKPVAAPPAPPATLAAQPRNFPKRSSSVPVMVRDQEEYSVSMGKLLEMGFNDMERNRQVLRHTQGNLSAAVDILSRLPGTQKPVFSSNNNNNNNQPMTEEDKLLRLNGLGFTNMAANRDALRRSGGNYEIALSILEGQKKQQQKPEIASAFSSSPSSNLEIAGRAQNALERQSHTLSGGKTGVLLDLESTTTTPTTSNPFHMAPSQPIHQQQQPIQQQPIQQQQQQPSFFSQPVTNPFGQNPSPAMTMSSSTPSMAFNAFAQNQQQSSPAFSNMTLQPQLTGMPSPAQNIFMQPQLTGMPSPSINGPMVQQPQLMSIPASSIGGAVQPQVTGVPSAHHNPFSQMTSAPTATAFPERFQMPQRANTTPDFPTFLHQQQQQQSPFTTAASPFHQQIPQQQQQQPSLIATPSFPNMVPGQPTGFTSTATAGTNANPWASGYF